MPHDVGLSRIPQHWRQLLAWAGWPLEEWDPEEGRSRDEVGTSLDLGRTSRDLQSDRHVLLICRGAGVSEREQIQHLILNRQVILHLNLIAQF